LKRGVFNMIKVKVPATSANLGSGFDCLGIALKLYLYLECEENFKRGIEFEFQGEGAEELSTNQHNLLQEAINLVIEKNQRINHQRGLKIRVINEIPIGRGLGSSAAAVVGGIVSAARFFNLDLTYSEVLRLTFLLEGHPDNLVPALIGGLTIAYETDQGEIKWNKISIPKDLSLILAIPDFTLSTKMMREVLPTKISLTDAVYNLSRVALLVNALTHSHWEVLFEAMQDKLHQPYRIPFIPMIEELFSKIKSTKLGGVALSGSGPSIISLVKKGSEDTIKKIMKDVFTKTEISYRILILEPDQEGTSAIDI